MQSGALSGMAAAFRMEAAFADRAARALRRLIAAERVWAETVASGPPAPDPVRQGLRDALAASPPSLPGPGTPVARAERDQAASVQSAG